MLNLLEKQTLTSLERAVKDANDRTLLYVEALYPAGTKVKYAVGNSTAYGTVIKAPIPESPTTVPVMNVRTEKVKGVSVHKLTTIEKEDEEYAHFTSVQKKGSRQ